MELDFEKLFKYLRIENSLIVLGVLSLLISIYNKYILGMKLGFLFLIFGATFRFYSLSIVNGLFQNYMDKFRYKRKTLVYDKEKNINSETEEYVIPFKKSWYIQLIDFIVCLIILLLLVYLFICLVEELPL